MITIDPRDGSGDLVAYLSGVAEEGRLEFGDASLTGEGPDGDPVGVGVEIKTVGDVLKCITDGRFSGHQLPGLVNSYQVVYLLIEGRWRRDFKSGMLQMNVASRRGGPFWMNASVGQRRFMWRDFDSWLMTIELKGGIRIRTTRDRQETAQFLKDLHSWWCPEAGGGWDKHQSHLAMHHVEYLRDQAMLIPPSPVRVVARDLPGIGDGKNGKAKGFEDNFDTVVEMVNAGEEEWAKVAGVGKKTASNIARFLYGKR